MTALRREKARALLGRDGVRQVSGVRYEVQGNAGRYEVVFHGQRPASCSCPAGSIWGEVKLRRYGKHVCYHVEAVRMLRRQTA